MDNQKDTQKTGLTSYGQANVPNSHALPNITNPSSHPIFEFANKKTEKLVTALYMVTDCMETEDALKGKLRQLGVELLSDMYKLSTSPSLQKSSHLSTSIARVHELLSFVEIACAIGFISDMNTVILKKEFSILLNDLQSHNSKEKHFTFNLDEQMFDLGENNRGETDQTLKNNITNISLNNPQFIKDKALDKRTNNNGMSFTSRSQISANQNQNYQKNLEENVRNKNESKEDRTSKILAIIKDKMMTMSGGDQGVAIKDISYSFTDCSEKTIQRELNGLVSKNKLKKLGAKRWSKYILITN